MSRLELIAAMALVAAATVWFLQQRDVRSGASESGGNVSTSTNEGAP